MTLLGTNTVETSSTTGSVTVGSAVSAATGNVVIVGVVWEGTGVPASISASDSRGNTYVVDESRGAGNGTATCAIIRGTITTALQVSDTITVTIGAARTRWCLQADSDSNFAASPLDQHTGNDNPGSSASLSTGTTGTTTQASERAYAVYGFGRASSQNITGVGGWSSTAQVNIASGTTPRGMQVAYTTLSATGTVQGTATLDAAATYVAAVVTYKLATPIAGSDSGALAESSATSATTSASDSGTLAESKALAATTTGTDAGALSESASMYVQDVLSTQIHMSWDGTAAFTGTYDDVTTRTLDQAGVTIAYGRDQARALSPTAPGRAAMELDNRSRDYSPDNTTSPLYGQIKPARPLRVQASLNGTTYILFRGHTDDYDVKPGRGDRSIGLTALDPIAKLQGIEISTQLLQGVRTGAAIAAVLDAVGWPADARDLDAGATTIRWWWAEKEDALEAVKKLIGSEGPGAFLHADTSGRVVFRDRHHRLMRTASNTVQATLTGDTEPAFSDPVGYDHGWRDIVNSVAFTAEERDPAPEPEAVHDEQDQVRTLGASETLTVRVETTDPVLTPAVTYTTLAGTVTPTLTQVSARTVDVALAAGVGGATIQGLAMTAYPVAVRRSYQVSAQDTASQADYGLRSPTVEAPWAGVYDAQAIADLMVGQRAQRLPILSVRLVSDNATRMVQQLGRDLSDRVHIREDETGTDADFFIEQIEHRLSNTGLFIETTFGLERAAVQPANVFRFDDAAHGFDDGVFGSTGMDEPAHIFRFDTAGAGFDDGVFAT